MALQVPANLSSDEILHRIKIVVIGDANIGKTFLMIAYQSSSSNPSIPTIFKSVKVNKQMTINDEQITVRLELSDTGSTDDSVHRNERIKAYKNANICLLCFSLSDPESLEHTQTKWIHEIEQYAANAMVILIGLKCDSKSDKITNDLINEKVGQLDAEEYIETSALNKINVCEAFEAGIRRMNFAKVKKKYSSIDEYDYTAAASDISLNTMLKNHNKQWDDIMGNQKMRIDTQDFADWQQGNNAFSMNAYGDVPPPPPLPQDENEDVELLKSPKESIKKLTESVEYEYTPNIPVKRTMTAVPSRRRGCCILL